MTAVPAKAPQGELRLLGVGLRRAGENIEIAAVHFYGRVNAWGVGHCAVQERRVEDPGEPGDLPVDLGDPGPDRLTAGVPQDVLGRALSAEAVIEVDDPPGAVDQAAPDGGTDLRAGDSGGRFS